MDAFHVVLMLSALAIALALVALALVALQLRKPAIAYFKAAKRAAVEGVSRKKEADAYLDDLEGLMRGEPGARDKAIANASRVQLPSNGAPD